MPTYTRANLETEVTAMVKGDFDGGDFDTLANRAVRQVLSDMDMRSMKRKSDLTPNLFDDVFQYTCPSDIKSNKVIDIQPQIDRERSTYWRLTTQEEFDRYKKEQRLDRWGDPITLSKHTHWLGENLVAISDDDMVRKLLLSRAVDDDAITIDALNAVGDWAAFGDGTNVTADTDDFVQGSGSVNWDINADGGTTAGIQNTSIDDFDVSDYKTTGSVFVWAYITSATNLTNFILRIGNDASNYYSITITTDNEGNSFAAGWKLLRFDFVDKSETGSVTDDECDYVVIYMTKDAAKVSETDYRFDNLVMRKGKHYSVVYYSKYGWVSSAGTRLENATADTDLLIVDTDEYDMICLKTAELIERNLGNHDIAKIHREDYEIQKTRYIFNNPSEALTLTQTYWDL